MQNNETKQHEMGKIKHVDNGARYELAILVCVTGECGEQRSSSSTLLVCLSGIRGQAISGFIQMSAIEWTIKLRLPG